MKRYKLKIIYFFFLLLPVLACCTDEEMFQRSGVVEGVPTAVDINVGTAANTVKTRSALQESEERKILQSLPMGFQLLRCRGVFT